MPPQEQDPYAGWARTLLDRFFGPHMVGQQARLVVTRGLLDQDYPHLGGSSGFLNAVMRGPGFLEPPIVGALNLHNHALILHRIWRQQSVKRPDRCFSLPDNAPLYLPHLAALCLGWTINPDDEELPANAFYDRLAVILPNHCLGSSELAKWGKMWDGLEEWTEGLGCKRGRFNVEILGCFRHVGIPLSQVLFTPSKVSRLAELFVTTGLADSWRDADASYLRGVLVAHENHSRAALGGMLFKEIKNKESEIGKAAAERLLEFLSDPKFREWPTLGFDIAVAQSGSHTNKKPILQVRLLLESMDGPAGWCCRFGLLGADPPNTTSRAADGWSFLKVDERLGGLWLACNEHSGDAPIDASEWAHALVSGFSIDCRPMPGHDDEVTTLKLPARRIRVFHETGWIGQRLVEEDALPASGGCFLLASKNVMGDLENWIQRFKESGGIVTDYTRQGLPTGSTLFHLAEMERAGDQLVHKFPEHTIAQSRSRSCVYLRGGSQIQGTGRQQVYLPYDPPDVVLVAPSFVRLECHGAILVDDMGPGNSWAVPNGMPGLESRQFRLNIEPNAGQVRVTAVADGKDWIPEVVIFGVGREVALGANFAEEAHVRFDSLGFRSNAGGILGSSIDREVILCEDFSDDWTFEERNIELGKPAMAEDADHPVWCLLESLAQNRRVTAEEFRRRSERILGWWPRYAWAEARWIRALCHIEIERDNRGRIAYVYPVPAHAYLLPWKDDGRWLAVVSGCPTRQALRSLLDAAGLVSVDVFAMERGSDLLPPRWLCCSNNLMAIELALEEAGMVLATEESKPEPLCWNVAKWAASMEQWKSGLLWLDGPAPASEEQFNPYRFRMARDEEFHCPCRLISLVDSLTSKYRWHILSHRKVTPEADIVPQHAFLLDPSWGKWLSMSKIASEFGSAVEDDEQQHIPLPFESADCFLHVPASLVFPTMLSRALLTSSGMPPVIMGNGSPQYRQEASIFMPSGDPPYEGACHRYDDLHPKVAQLVCAKVQAQTIEV